MRESDVSHIERFLGLYLQKFVSLAVVVEDLILRYGARRVADPMQGSGTIRDVVEGLNKYKKTVLEVENYVARQVSNKSYIISQAYQYYVTLYQTRYYGRPPLYATTEPQ